MVVRLRRALARRDRQAFTDLSARSSRLGRTTYPLARRLGLIECARDANLRGQPQSSA